MPVCVIGRLFGKPIHSEIEKLSEMLFLSRLVCAEVVDLSMFEMVCWAVSVRRLSSSCVSIDESAVGIWAES